MNSFAISDADRRLIPSSGLRGPVPLLIAIMTFVMVVVAAAGLALANTGAVIRAGVEHRYSIQIADGAAMAETWAPTAPAQLWAWASAGTLCSRLGSCDICARMRSSICE